MEIEIVDDPNEKSRACEAILRSLPEWFGIEASLLQYVEDVKTRPTWIAREAGRVVGFLSVTRHFPATAEVHVMGVSPERHGGGLGTLLLGAAESALRSEGVRFLTVKTLSPAREDAAYARTRGFYERSGFVPLEEFKTLWGSTNPCLMLAKAL